MVFHIIQGGTLLKKGHAIEMELKHWLDRAGCRVITSKFLDISESVDYVIWNADGKTLSYPVEIQVTIRRDDLLKLEHFLKNKKLKRRTIILYIEMEEGVSLEMAAKMIKTVALELQDYKYAHKITGITVRQSGKFIPFNPDERLAELRRLAAPDYPGRKDGKIAKITDNGLLIASAGGSSWFWAYDNDIADQSLKQSIYALRLKQRGNAFAGVPVSFIPAEMQRGRQRAKIVILRK